MNNQNQRWVLAFLAGLCWAITLLVMIAWFIPSWKAVLSIIPGAPTMKFNTALVLCLGASSVLLHYFTPLQFRWVRGVLGTGIIAIALLTLIEYLFGFTLVLDELFVRDPYSLELPGRMSPATAVSGSLLGLSILGSVWKQLVKLTQWIILIVLLISLTSILVYVLQVPVDHRVFLFKTMAIHTSFVFMILAWTKANLMDSVGFMKEVKSNASGGRLFRRFMPFLVLFPLGLGFLLLSLNNAGLMALDFGLTLLILGVVLLGGTYLLNISTRLNAYENQLRETNSSLSELNRSLNRVKEGFEQGFMVIQLNRNGEMADLNQAVLEVTGFKKKDMLNRPFELLEPSTIGTETNEILNLLWQKEIWTGELKLTNNEGKPIWWLSSSIPFENAAGELEEVLLISKDITLKKNAELALSSDYVKQLEIKNQELEQFAFIASHDLQEPLVSIRTFAELIKEIYSEVLDDEGKQFLKFILDSAERMQALIKGLLEYSRIGRSGVLAKVDLNETLREVMESLTTQINQANAQLEIKELPTVIGYGVELNMLFQNLISNAIKYSRPDIYPIVKVTAEETDREWIISVADNGKGIPEEYKEKVFRIFQRLEDRQEVDGAGIGLAHCKKIAELHNAQLVIADNKSEGSIFVFSLPKNHDKVPKENLVG